VPLQYIRFKLLQAYSNISQFPHRKTSVLGIQRLWFSNFTAVKLTPKDYTRIRTSIADSNWSHMRQTIHRNSNRRATASTSVAQLSVHWDGYWLAGEEKVGGVVRVSMTERIVTRPKPRLRSNLSFAVEIKKVTETHTHAVSCIRRGGQFYNEDVNC
jgi:hypothetical protein